MGLDVSWVTWRERAGLGDKSKVLVLPLRSMSARWGFRSEQRRRDLDPESWLPLDMHCAP